MQSSAPSTRPRASSHRRRALSYNLRPRLTFWWIRFAMASTDKVVLLLASYCTMSTSLRSLEIIRLATLVQSYNQILGWSHPSDSEIISPSMVCTCQFPDDLFSKGATTCSWWYMIRESDENHEILDEITISSEFVTVDGRKTGVGRPPIQTLILARTLCAAVSWAPRVA